MFLLIYLALISLSAIPLLVAMYRSRRPEHAQSDFTAQYLLGGSYILIALAGIFLLEMWVFDIAAEALWYAELKQSARYWAVFYYRVAIFFSFWVMLSSFFGYNLALLAGPLEKIPNWAAWMVSIICSMFVAFPATSMWMPIMAHLAAEPTGVLDPIFGKDISFYLLSLPFYQTATEVGFWMVLAVLCLWAAASSVYPKHMWLGQIDEYDSRFRSSGKKTREEHDSFVEGAARHFDSWRRHGLALGALFFAVCGADRLVDRYALVVSGHSSVVAGAAYADAHWWIPAYTFIAYLWFAVAIALASAAFVPSVLNFFERKVTQVGRVPLHAGSIAALAALVMFVAGPLWALFGQYLHVRPNEITLEQSYIKYTIDGTRAAYNLAGPSVSEREFKVTDKPLNRADMEKYSATMRDARIWDWRPLGSQIQQTQGLRQYYTFGDIDVDRYYIDGEIRQVMVIPRELDQGRLQDQAKVWVNQRLKYTHGFGMVAVPVNEMDNRGNPHLWSKDIPVTSKPDLAVKKGAIYYGEFTNTPVYVNTTEKEFDFPQGEANAETVYDGKGGIVLSSFWRKLVFARQLDGLRFYLSDYFTPESRVLLNRNVFERVKLLAPFLSFDRDTYIVAGGDHYYWILDGYTASKNYPYSEEYKGTIEAFKGYNYVRNSVKTVIDAYDGSVTFYVFDNRDPIIKAYREMLPGLFKDASEMPENLRRHTRYPEDLFTVQAEMYGTYHMTNPTTFYNREDKWEVPRQPHGGQALPLLPYYVTAQLPDSVNPEFMLMLPLSVAGKNQMAGWLAGLSDGDNYGKLVAFTFPKGVFVDGPTQVDSRISSNEEMSQKFTLWNQQGSRVIRGNLLIIPLGDALIAIEPVYIEAERTKIPTLTRVILAQLMPNDRNIVWGSTLQEAQDLLIGAAPKGPVAPTTPVTGSGMEQLKALFDEMRKAFSTGDFSKAGERLQELGKALGQ